MTFWNYFDRKLRSNWIRIEVKVIPEDEEESNIGYGSAGNKKFQWQPLRLDLADISSYWGNCKGNTVVLLAKGTTWLVKLDFDQFDLIFTEHAPGNIIK